MIAWNSQRFLDNHYLFFIGIAFFFVGILDILHTVTHRGMGVSYEHSENIPTQFWIAARYLQAGSFLVAPVFLGRRISQNISLIFSGYLLVASLTIWSILYAQNFPDCYVEGSGVTVFKRMSDYAIALLFLIAAVALARKRREFDEGILLLFIASIISAVFSELAFTFDSGSRDFANLGGHVFKILSYYCIYRAVINTGLVKPYALIFRNLKQSEVSLQGAKEELEKRVTGRTAELLRSNELLRQEIAERKETELMLRQHEEMLRESEEKFKNLAASAQDAIIMLDQEGLVSYWNDAAERIFGYSSGEIIGREMHRLLAPGRFFENYQAGFHQFRQSGEGPFLGKILELTAVRKDGSEFPVEFSVSGFNLRGRWHAISILRDITKRKKTEEMLQRQLESMTALRDIDLAISASLDLRVTLNILLDRVITQLRVDAADVLLLDQHTLYLNYAAGRGFYSSAIQNARVRFGRGHAGLAAYEGRIMSVPDLGDSITHALHDEGFVSYYAVPLVTQGKVKGVLEIFQRSPLTPDPEWLNVLEVMAGQAAIAIENASMFTSLQRFNIELSLAYDATLEGWGRTLEFRDEDTKGHTERVTESTIRLARLMGMGDDELVHVRRGALLHDIGKIGIPDSILLKPGPLDKEETAIMRRHPVYAFDLLSPIPFLRPSLDIPYCHHERWDGTGYPRQLKGEDIPLAARVFAVIDTADALQSDRPYRPAWSKEQVREYVSSLSGSAFDPRVVEAFLGMEWD